MGRWGSTTLRRARQMRRVLAWWQRSGSTLREFGEQREIPLSMLTWWRQVFRRAGEQVNVASKGIPASDAAVFTEYRVWQQPRWCHPCWRSSCGSGHVVRVPVGVDTECLQRVLQALQTTC